MSLITRLVWLLFPKRKRREIGAARLSNYQLLRARIKKAHFNRPMQNGFEIKLDEPFDLEDLRSFKAPMYRFSFNRQGLVCIAWDSEKMTEEIGSGDSATKDDGTQNPSREVLPET